MKNKKIVIVSALCVLTVLAMLLALRFSDKNGNDHKFMIPDFDKTAETGVPKVPENLGYSKIHQDGMNFTAYVCGNVMIKDHEGSIYFTNDSENKVWLKLRILDENNEILGETGVIKPGEYVSLIKLKKTPQVGQKIKLKIMAYEPDTYYSAGAVSLYTTIGE
ncbi:hypothetical protein [[Eubacterium] hominis]|uniref:hypothetical protein n=1 Tax=[Eubacterium] hominis TaxID=2764325 RepID=UPI003A4D9A02